MQHCTFEACEHCDGSGKRWLDVWREGWKQEMMCKACGGSGIVAVCEDGSFRMQEKREASRKLF